MNCPSCNLPVPCIEDRDYDGVLMAHVCPLCGLRVACAEYLRVELAKGWAEGGMKESTDDEVVAVLERAPAVWTTQLLVRAALHQYHYRCLLITRLSDKASEVHRWLAWERTRLIEYLERLVGKGGGL